MQQNGVTGNTISSKNAEIAGVHCVFLVSLVINVLNKLRSAKLMLKSIDIFIASFDVALTDCASVHNVVNPPNNMLLQIMI